MRKRKKKCPKCEKRYVSEKRYSAHLKTHNRDFSKLKKTAKQVIMTLLLGVIGSLFLHYGYYESWILNMEPEIDFVVAAVVFDRSSLDTINISEPATKSQILEWLSFNNLTAVSEPGSWAVKNPKTNISYCAFFTPIEEFSSYTVFRTVNPNLLHPHPEKSGLTVIVDGMNKGTKCVDSAKLILCTQKEYFVNDEDYTNMDLTDERCIQKSATQVCQNETFSGQFHVKRYDGSPHYEVRKVFSQIQGHYTVWNKNIKSEPDDIHYVGHIYLPNCIV